MRHGTIVVTLIAVLASGPITAGRQTAPEPTRQLISEEFLKARPAAPGKAAGPAASSAGVVDLGLTIWRIRPVQPKDDGARLLVQEPNAGEMTAERVNVGAPLAIGDRVRLSIESSSAGRLYVIDRELYADGTMSEPYLIFPTARTRQGNNTLRAGRLVDIPDQRDRPSYFTVRPSRPGQVGELITLVVGSAPLDVPPIGDAPVLLPKDRVANWEKTWTSPVRQFADTAGPTRLWTRQEQAAAGDGTRLLTQDDPAPQTIFRVSATKGAPVLIGVRLPYATSNR